ncbi:tetratricopeptide repeat-containing sensor histidine kinase [Hymenobacter sp. BT683]|uniref:histidine kinase n=1 Tax=Hymenobacter jeongseonensis TaxID=2791027 RepID=A0ABS0IL59_9BACT|nr:tetratricopeptide repeat-containing sensor histidine kinase [Hymenobacter jeongseonensis]MBF9239103.1 tetratricopeptide repeat-containing sensor histidine kinase [Hymenobacter jeongseonensis]
MRRIYLLLMVTLLVPFGLLAQKLSSEELRTALQAQPRADTARVNRLNALALALRNTEVEESAGLFRQALRLAQQLAYTAGAAEARLGLGFYYRHHGEYGLSHTYSEQARQDFARVGDREGQTRSLYNLSAGYSEQGRYVKSLEANLRGLALAEAMHDRKWMAFLNTRLGVTSTFLGEYEHALDYLNQGMKWAKESGDPQSIGNAHAGLGDLARMQGQWAQAQRSYEQEAIIAQQTNNQAGQLFEELNIGEMAERQGKYAQAFTHGLHGLAEARRLHVLAEVPRAQLLLARALLNTGQPDSALVYAKKSLQGSQRNGTKTFSRDASEVIAQASYRLGRYADAYRYEQLFSSYKDSLNSSDLQRRAAVLEYRADLAKKQAQIGLLTKNDQLIRKQNRAQQWFLLGALLSLGAVAALSAVLWRSNGQKRRAYALLKQQQDELHAAQGQLVQAEKWAFVGELSAGIAHELQNPLNFMKNFAEVSVAMLSAEDKGRPPGRPGAAELEKEIMAGLKQNLLQISQHGQRASSIINDMLAHARSGTGQRVPTDLNALAGEALALAYEALCATDSGFRVLLVKEFDPELGAANVVPQDFSRVLLNLCANALYAVRQQQAALAGQPGAYEPTVTLSTRRIADHAIEIRVRDNGAGMSDAVRAKIFEPFFTTKPAGEGTGLGLSLSYDIVTKGHGGTLTVESREGHGTEFLITLPR